MVFKRPNFKRGGARGGFRGPNGGGDYGNFGGQAPPARSIYDYTLDRANLAGTKNTTDTTFEKEIIDRATALIPTIDFRNRVNELAKKVMAALEKERVEKTLTDIGVERIMHVGSFVTDTSTKLSDKSDVVVQLSVLPSFESVSELGDKILENMKKVDEKDASMALPREYGCSIISKDMQIRVLVTINPAEASKLEPGLHLESREMMINYFAVRHIKWFTDLKKTMPSDFMQEYQALVRVLKDVRSRFSDLQHLSIWALQYLAFYCLANGPNRQKISLGTAFRRFFEIIAAGVFLPKAACLVDPTTPMYRIGFDLTLPQMDALCMGAQTIVRIFATGNDGYRAVLGTHGAAIDLTQATTTWKGIEIRPSLDAYLEGCMDPVFEKPEAQTV